MCQGYSHFSGFLYHFVLAKLAASSDRVNDTVGTKKTKETNTIFTALPGGLGGGCICWFCDDGGGGGMGGGGIGGTPVKTYRQ